MLVAALTAACVFTFTWVYVASVRVGVFGLFLYVIPGHALVYGPHLFALVLWHLLTGHVPEDER